MQFLLEALILGLIYGLGPCMVSCAPVLVPIITASAKDYKQGIIATLIFSLGRIISYAILGAISGFFGKTLDRFISPRVIGIVLIFVAVSIFFNFHNRCLISKLKITGYHLAFVSGIVMGFTPCGPMVAALALAILAKSIFLGAIIGVVFGIGTTLSPLLIIGLISGAWAKKLSSNPEFYKINNYVCAIFLMIIGVLYLLSL
jgi:sulfite exporter TauE/SafE